MTAWRWMSRDNNKLNSSPCEVPEVVQITLPKETGAQNSFAKELRAVGQALEKFKFSSFKLGRRDGVYTVTGAAADLEATFSLIQFIRDLARGDKTRSRTNRSLNSIEISYSQTEIDNLESKERAKRTRADKQPDPYSISQILRGVGAFLDTRHAALLLAISFQDRWVTVLYKTADGRVEQEKQDLDYFYDYWVKMYLRRSNRPQLAGLSEPTLHVQWEPDQQLHKVSKLPL